MPTVSSLHPQRRGFTLVELLVVIGIIGTLIGLLLPAVQRVRESGRRTQCQSNCRQMGLALTNYESVKKTFPPGSTGLAQLSGTVPVYHAWSSFILPFLDDPAVAGKIDYTKPFNDPAGNLALAQVVLGTYVCPSGIHRYAGKQDYAGVMGSGRTLSGSARAASDSSNGVLYALDPAEKRLKPASARMVTDGLSKTILVAEAVDRAFSDADEASGNASDASFTSASAAWGDAIWACGSNCEFMTDTVNSINSMSFRSRHRGGAFGLFADGHVAFIEDGTDPQVLVSICTRADGETVPVGL